MDNLTADLEIVRARRVSLLSAPTVPAVLAVWNKLKEALETYAAAVAAQSLSSEGVSRNMSVAEAARNVKEWLLVYDAVVAENAEDAVEMDPNVMAQPMGHTFDHSGVWLR
jgi:hypothetical protein